MPFAPEAKAAALIASGRRCCICHKFCGVRVECHHIVPEGAGGPDTLENCIPLCFDCHAEVEHYNSRHPNGNKFTLVELRGHRDKRHKMLADSTIQGLERSDAFGGTPKQAAPPAAVEVHETEILILCALAYGSEWMAEIELAQSAGINIQRVKFHLTELRKRGFVRHAGGGYVPGNWALGHEGRRFLIENNLIG